MNARSKGSSSLEGVLPGIRNGVRAVVVRDGRVLFLRKKSPEYGERFVLPGGSQDLGETLEAALQRECREEIGVAVEIIDLIRVADFRKPRGTRPQTYRHQVEFLFSCAVPDDYVPVMGSKPDRHQIDVVWLAIDELKARPVFPAGLADTLAAFSDGTRPVYMGEME